MTMVAACRAGENAIIIADSRATWLCPGAPILQDVLQKILPMGAPKIGVAFAGDVGAAALVIQQLRRRHRQVPHSRLLRKLAADVPRIARHYYGLQKARTRRDLGLALILFGATESGQVEVYSFESPHFHSVHLAEGFLVVGSGRVVAGYLESNLFRLTHEITDLKGIADALVIGLEAALQGSGVETVGGLFQCVLVSPEGIRPYKYGFVDMDPDAAARAKEIEMVAGRWFQRDLGGGKEVRLVEPGELRLLEAREFRVHDMHEASRQLPKWHLTYFITCLGAQITPEIVEFKGVLSATASPSYPLTVNLLVAVGVWGSAGEQELVFSLESGGGRKEIHHSRVRIEIFPEEIDVVRELTLTVDKPGAAFLECVISGQSLGRRALYFGEAPIFAGPEKGFGEFARQQVQELHEKIRASVDPLLEASGSSELVYFSVCQGCVDDGMLLRLERPIAAAYWKQYPLPLRMFLATALRMPAGKHQLRVDLVDVATRRTSQITTATVESRSSCIVTPVHGEVIALVPAPGWYFVNVSVDDRRLGTTVLAAETDRPRYSYDLADEILAQVSAGELFVLLKRSRQEAPSA